ncbi:MAG TPA: hypothetical protein DF383_12340, partial [Deltaproteobacteria bacterium]|nr:hypothetical protein [Deltaproteobacteria bacterium]
TLSYEAKEIAKEADEVISWSPERIQQVIKDLKVKDIRTFAKHNEDVLDERLETSRGYVDMALSLNGPLAPIVNDYVIQEKVAKLSDAELQKELDNVKTQLLQYFDPKQKSVIHIVGSLPTK